MGTMLPTVLLVAGLEWSTHLAHALGWMTTVLSVEWTQLLFPFGLVAIAVPTTMACVALLTTRHPVAPSLTMPPTPTEHRCFPRRANDHCGCQLQAVLIPALPN